MVARRIMSGFVFGAVLAQVTTASAAGWTQPEGAFYAKIWNRSLFGGQVFVRRQITAELPDRYQDHRLHIYGEYGIRDDWTLTLNAIPVAYASFGGEDRVYSAGGSLGVRYRLLSAPISVALEAQVGARPRSGVLGEGTVEFDPGSGVEMREFIAEPSVSSGYGSFDVQAGFGLSFLWMSATVGIRGFTNPSLGPAVYINSQIGWISKFGLIIDLHLSYYHSTGSIGPLNLYGAGQTRYVGFGFGATWWVHHRVGVNIGVDGAFFATANAATPSLNIGMEFK